MARKAKAKFIFIVERSVEWYSGSIYDIQCPLPFSSGHEAIAFLKAHGFELAESDLTEEDAWVDEGRAQASGGWVWKVTSGRSPRDVARIVKVAMR